MGCEERSRLAALVKLAESIKRLADAGDGWDADPYRVDSGEGPERLVVAGRVYCRAVSSMSPRMRGSSSSRVMRPGW